MDLISASVTPSASVPSSTEPAKLPDIMGQIRGMFDDGKTKVTSSLDGFVKTAHDIADKLQASGVGPVANYARRGAAMVTAWSENLDSKSLEDLVDDARSFVHDKPKAAIGLSLIAGFVVSRLFKIGSPSTAPSR